MLRLLLDHLKLLCGKVDVERTALTSHVGTAHQQLDPVGAVLNLLSNSFWWGRERR
jgi:hypothetical protein